MELIVVAVLLLTGLDWWRMVLLVSVLFAPLLVAALLVPMVWRRWRVTDDTPALFCEALASDLRSGASLRAAILSAASSIDGRLSADLVPFSSAVDMAPVIAQELESIGPELEATINSVAASGPRAADLFDEIGGLAIANAEIEREIKVATAPAKATAFVFVSAPILYVGAQLGSGGFAALMANPHQRWPALIGLVLFILGLLAAGTLLRRAV